MKDTDTIQEVNLETAKRVQAFLVAKGYLSEHLPTADDLGYILEVEFVQVGLWSGSPSSLTICLADSGEIIVDMSARFATVESVGSIIDQALKVTVGGR